MPQFKPTVPGYGYRVKMKYKKMPVVATTEEVEITEFPAYLKYSDIFFSKVISETRVIHIGLLLDMANIEIRFFLTDNDWQPCTPEEFYEAAAEAMRRINEPLGLEMHTLEVKDPKDGGFYKWLKEVEMHTLEPKGGAYAD